MKNNIQRGRFCHPRNGWKKEAKKTFKMTALDFTDIMYWFNWLLGVEMALVPKQMIKTMKITEKHTFLTDPPQKIGGSKQEKLLFLPSPPFIMGGKIQNIQIQSNRTADIQIQNSKIQNNRTAVKKQQQLKKHRGVRSAGFYLVVRGLLIKSGVDFTFLFKSTPFYLGVHGKILHLCNYLTPRMLGWMLI
jgi:hypothetical protein